jgi:hypothetical protein
MFQIDLDSEFGTGNAIMQFGESQTGLQTEGEAVC